MDCRRLKASTLTVPKHMYANPFRIVILELKHKDHVEYATVDEIIDRDPTQVPANWFCHAKFSKEFSLETFEERMQENNVKEDTEFKEDKEYSKW